jgi:protein-disulfide isomerase
VFRRYLLGSTTNLKFPAAIRQYLSDGAANLKLSEAVTRRNLIILGAVLVVGGAAGAYLWSGQSADVELTTAAAVTVASSDLMQPGPLGDRMMGADNAPVTIVEYASMTCPHCANFAVNVLPKIKERYIDTGKVRFIFREFPLDPVATGAFMLARCADKDKYFPLIETLFQQQAKWAVREPMEPLLAIAKQVGFTQNSFKECLSNQKVLDGIEWVRNRAVDKFKVNATPSFFINGEMHRGEMTLDEMEKAIQPLLNSKS